MNYDFYELGEGNSLHPNNRSFNYTQEEMLQEEINKYRDAVESAVEDLEKAYEILFNTIGARITGLTDAQIAQFHDHFTNAKYILFTL